MPRVRSPVRRRTRRHIRGCVFVSGRGWPGLGRREAPRWAFPQLRFSFASVDLATILPLSADGSPGLGLRKSSNLTQSLLGDRRQDQAALFFGPDCASALSQSKWLPQIRGNDNLTSGTNYSAVGAFGNLRNRSVNPKARAAANYGKY